MDNFHIDITCEGQAPFLKAFEIAFGAHRAATHYAVRQAVAGERQEPREGGPNPPPWKWGQEPKPLRLVFMWTAGGKDAVQLPFKLDAVGAADFATRWLAEQSFGTQPDHDGDNGRGWRVYNEGWGHVDDEYQGWLAVTPAWAMYGK